MSQVWSRRGNASKFVFINFPLIFDSDSSRRIAITNETKNFKNDRFSWMGSKGLRSGGTSRTLNFWRTLLRKKDGKKRGGRCGETNDSRSLENVYFYFVSLYTKLDLIARTFDF